MALSSDFKMLNETSGCPGSDKFAVVIRKRSSPNWISWGTSGRLFMTLRPKARISFC